MKIRKSALSIVYGMFWFGILCLLTSLIGLISCGIFFVINVTPETAIQQFQNTRQAMVGFAAMSAGVSFTMVCFARCLKKTLMSLTET
jgi:hypothetical protein